MEKIIRFFGEQNVVVLWLLNGLFFAIAYLGTNHLRFFTARELPFLAFEKTIPFLVATTPLYLSSFVQMPLAILLFLKNKRGIFFTTVVLLLFFNGIIFLLFPTTYPRPVLHEVPTGFSGWLYNLTIHTDTPQNCFPSEHVATALLVSFVFLKERKKWGMVFLVWSAGIIVSTLTTKQHYAWDLVGGTVEAVLFYVVYVMLEARYNTNL